MIINNLTGYIDYFRQLAKKHKDIKHDPAAETGDSAIGKLRFCKWSADELITSLRTKISFPALLIELYEVETESPIVYDIRRKPKGAFTVLEHCPQGNIRDEERAYALTESVVYDILKQIWQDHYNTAIECKCDTPFKSFEFDKLLIVPTGKILENEFGWRVEFDFEFQNNIDISKAPADGTFID